MLKTGAIISMAIVLIAGIAIGLYFVMVSLSNPDTVSQARQGWISRRSEKDEQGW